MACFAKWQDHKMLSITFMLLLSPIKRMLSWCNIMLTKWQDGKMASWQNVAEPLFMPLLLCVKLMLHHVDKTASWQNGATCYATDIVRYEDVKLMQQQVYKMVPLVMPLILYVKRMLSWCNIKLTKWHVGKTARWQNVAHHFLSHCYHSLREC